MSNFVLSALLKTLKNLSFNSTLRLGSENSDFNILWSSSCGATFNAPTLAALSLLINIWPFFKANPSDFVISCCGSLFSVAHLLYAAWISSSVSKTSTLFPLPIAFLYTLLPSLSTILSIEPILLSRVSLLVSIFILSLSLIAIVDNSKLISFNLSTSGVTKSLSLPSIAFSMFAFSNINPKAFSFAPLANSAGIFTPALLIVPRVSNSVCFCSLVISPTLNLSSTFLEASLKKLSTWAKLAIFLFERSNMVETFVADALNSIPVWVAIVPANGNTSPTNPPVSPASFISLRSIYLDASPCNCIPLVVCAIPCWTLSVRYSPKPDFPILTPCCKDDLEKFLISPLNNDPSTVLASLPKPKAFPVFLIIFSSEAYSNPADKAAPAIASALLAYFPFPIASAISLLVGVLSKSSLSPVSIAS